MKIVRLLGNRQVVLEDAPRPKPEFGEVLVKAVVSALCGSEMSAYFKEGVSSGNMGHEAAGIVAELGEGVETPEIGRRVGVSAIAGCGKCDYCARGQYTWCENLRFYGNMHAEYFVVPALACHVLPAEVPWDVGVLITGDGLGVPYHTSRKISGDAIHTIAVFGLGPIGLGNVLLQSYLGREVIGIDYSPERLSLSRQLGARHTIATDITEDIPAAIRALTAGKGPDVCIEAAGKPITAKHCFASVRKGGTVIFNGEQPSLELSPSQDFIRRDITATGSWYYHYSEYPHMRDLFERGLPVSSLVTHRFSPDQVSEAYRVMAEGKSGKALLVYDSSA
jgi:threonine dehydrogenase-like Zn-dependent dehydrogenase